MIIAPKPQDIVTFHPGHNDVVCVPCPAIVIEIGKGPRGSPVVLGVLGPDGEVLTRRVFLDEEFIREVRAVSPDRVAVLEHWAWPKRAAAA